MVFSANIVTGGAFSKTYTLNNNNSFQYVSVCMHEDWVANVQTNVVPVLVIFKNIVVQVVWLDLLFLR